MKKIYYNKLVRDKIPAKIIKKDSDCKIKELNKLDFQKALLKKVEEEASGVASAQNKKELISEIADLYDVIDEIKKIKNISSVQIKKSQQDNYKKKGGFNKRIFLFWSSDDGYKANERTR